MAITRAQQARQMLKDGNFVMQGGVRNYLGKQETVSDVPLKWQSGPNKPSTELAYITKAEKDLLLKEDIHGSLKNGPNEGPAGIISLDSFGDKDDKGRDVGMGGGDVSRAERGDFRDIPSDRREQAKDIRAGAVAAGARESEKEKKDREFQKRKAEIQKQVEKRKREAAAAITKQEKKEARANRKAMEELKKRDRIRRQERIKNVLARKTKNPFGLTDTELADLKAAGLYDDEEGLLSPELTSSSLSELQQDLIDQFLEKSDKFSGAEMEAFKEKFNMPDLPGVLGLGLNIASPFLKKGSRKTKDFFTDDVLDAGRFTYKGQVVTPEMFQFLSPTEMQEVYGDYMDRRMGGDIDAYGNPIIRQDNEGPDPILPILPTTPTTPQTPTTPAVDPTMFRFLNRGGMVEDAPVGTGIMDLEAARQMMFLGGIAKGIKKGLKGVTRAAKKVFKSPFGKAALLAAPFVMGGGAGSFFGKGSFNPFLRKVAGDTAFSGLGEALSKIGLVNKSGGLTAGGIGSLFGITSLLAALQKPKEDENFDLESYYEKEGLSDFLANLGQRNRFLAEGGKAEPVAKKTMPLLDLDGQEMDFRAEGGFVPIGRMEKADDVPARLSKNEFVFTAEAVRNAGDGDVDKGAEVMYNTMKNLEAGGKVSEETQGLDGAKEMFQTAQRLEGVM